MFRTGVIACSIVLLIAGAVLAATHRPAATYSRDEVSEAFAAQGFELVDADPEDQFVGFRRTRGILVPKGGERFYVVVTISDAVAREGFDSFTQLALPPATFDLLSGNVLVVSDSGLAGNDRKRIRVAMQLLREPPATVKQLAECAKPYPFPPTGQLNESNSGSAVACLVVTGNGGCQWWEGSSFRGDGSVESWTPRKRPDPGLCIKRQPTLQIYDPTGRVKLELSTSDVEPSSARAERQPGGYAVLYVGFTRKGAAKFCRLTRALAIRGARLHRQQRFAIAVGPVGGIFARPQIDYRATPDGICGVPGLEVQGLRPALARQLAQQIRAG